MQERSVVAANGRGRWRIGWALGLAVVLAAPAGAGVRTPAHHAGEPDGKGFGIQVLSSAPDQVTGGDALVRVSLPRGLAPERVALLRNGEDVSVSLAPEPGRRSLVGLVGGLALGKNVLELRLRKPASEEGSASLTRHPLATLRVRNHPASGPIFSGPQQQPFVCTTARVGLGQPLVDNQDGFGIPVAREDANGDYPRDGRGYPTADAEIVGWSRDCAAPRRFDYRYRTVGGQFLPLASPSEPLPADIATTTTLDGRTVPYIVRWERGTSNRFVYSIAMLAPVGEADPARPDDSLWNGRLVFSLQGGVAIGRTQGTTSESAMLLHDVLQLGYAVVNSTGLRTNTHYNLQVGGETALMLKERFVEGHGVPLYTVGVGGSGGGIQQYVYGQNHPGLLDAAIPQYSYPDMVTQTIHVGDCELLEHYFDVTDKDNPRWRSSANRRAVQGLNASASPTNLGGSLSQWQLLYTLYEVLGLNVAEPEPPDSDVPALTECRKAWIGLTPLVLNPTFTNVSDIDKLAQGTEGEEWTHMRDLVNVYGVDEDGWARSPWDNVGVQYGLQALRDGVLTPAEFLDLNARVGSWKETRDMVVEGFPFVGGFDLFNFDPWSSRNMNLSPDGGATPAARRSGDLEAIRATYRTGMRFDGKITIPVIDWRHYLEDELDMHHSHQSFAARRRIELARGHADNQVIWFTDARPARAFDQTPEAFAVIDEWMANLRARPWRGVAGNKPARAVDRCFDTDGAEIAAGEDVWDGVLDDAPPGACTERFPLHRTSRIVAGGPIEGGIFKCRLQSVAEAVAAGEYGGWVPDAAEQARLEQIFPEGVCDWSRGDAGRPRPERGHRR
jgi:hypothetical protein